MATVPQGQSQVVSLGPNDAIKVSTPGEAYVDHISGTPESPYASARLIKNTEPKVFGPYGANAQLRVRAIESPALYDGYTDPQPALVNIGPTTGQTVIVGPGGVSLPLTAYPPIDAFGITSLDLSDNTTNQSTEFFSALQAAYDAGVTALSIPDGKRINLTTGGTNPGVSLYTNSGEIHNISPLGVNGRINHAYTRGVVYSGIRFICDNTPKSATNNATELSICLRFVSGEDNRIENCSFDNYYGACALFRHETSPVVKGCIASRCFKDSFHFTGNTDKPLIIDTEVVNGGDDGIAFVSYETGNAGGIGLVTNGRAINCTVNGVKFARGISVVGGDNILIENCIIDGRIPSIYEEDASRFAHGGLLICGERTETSGVENYRTYPATNITVRNTKVLYCGSSTGSHQYAAVSILNYSTNPKPCKNILLDGLTVDGSPSTLLHIRGSATGNIEGVRIRNSSLSRNNDPLGVNGIAGAGTRGGIDISNAKDTDIELSLSETAGAGLYVAPTCTGYFRGEIQTKNICSSVTTGPRRILNGGPNPELSSIDFKVTMLEQPYATGTTPYGLDRSILWQGCLGKVKRLELITTIPQHASVGLPLTSQSWSENINQTITWSANSWVNTQPTPVSVALTKTASLTISKGLALLGTLPVYMTGTNIKHTFTVQPGETVTVDDTTGLTAVWRPVTF